MLSILQSKKTQIVIALLIGITILMLPRPEGTQYKITGDPNHQFFQQIKDHFKIITPAQSPQDSYVVEANEGDSLNSFEAYLNNEVARFKDGKRHWSNCPSATRTSHHNNRRRT